MTASAMIDVVTKMLLLVLLLVPQSGASDKDTATFWNMVTSLRPLPPRLRPHSQSLPQSLPQTLLPLGEAKAGPTLEELISEASKLRLDPRSLADLDQGLRASYPNLEETDKQISKRTGFGGLLCCNSPPTHTQERNEVEDIRRPPSLSKRGDSDERFKEWIVSQLLGYNDGSSEAESTRPTIPGYERTDSSPGTGDQDMRRNGPFWSNRGRSNDLHPLWPKRARVTALAKKTLYRSSPLHRPGNRTIQLVKRGPYRSRPLARLERSDEESDIGLQEEPEKRNAYRSRPLARLERSDEESDASKETALSEEPRLVREAIYWMKNVGEFYMLGLAVEAYIEGYIEGLFNSKEECTTLQGCDSNETQQQVGDEAEAESGVVAETEPEVEAEVGEEREPDVAAVVEAIRRRSEQRAVMG